MRNTVTPFSTCNLEFPVFVLDVLIERIKAFLFIFNVWRNDVWSHELDHRAPLDKLKERIQIYLPEFTHYFLARMKQAFGSQNYHYVDRRYEWKKESKGLFIFIHGLTQHPSNWDKHVGLIGEEFDVFTPFVPHGGLCDLEESAEPIYEHIRRYAEEFPERKICVIGHSNGGRIADYIDIRLRKDAPKTALMVSTIAAAHLGSYMANMATFIWGNCCYQELSYNSPKARATIDEVKTPLEAGVVKREYVRYGSLDDHIVPLRSAFVELGKGERNIVVHGVSHTSIVPVVAEDQIALCKDFLNR